MQWNTNTKIYSKHEYKEERIMYAWDTMDGTYAKVRGKVGNNGIKNGIYKGK